MGAKAHRTVTADRYDKAVTHISRRSLILAAAGIGLSRHAAAQGLEPGRSVTADPFALGVASGDPSLDGFVIWTRLVGALGEALDAPAVPVAYEIAADEGFRRIVRAGRIAASPRLGHSVHVEVAGLEPGRPYWYRFHALGVASPAGRAATAPRHAASARIAVTSCQHYEQAWFSAYRDLVAAQPDLVVQLGDYIYEISYPTGVKVRRFGAPEPTDLDGYRRRHALYKTDPDLRAAHAAAPWIVTWDDHDVQNDYADLANLGAADPAVFARRRAAAYQAYFEHMPVRPSRWAGPGGPRLYRHIAWGDLFAMPVLDGRQYRSAQACNPERLAGNRMVADCARIDAPDRTMLGAAQETWLSRMLGAPQPAWTLIAQQTVVAPINLAGGVMTDQWDGYAAARSRLLGDLSRPQVRNAVILSGDIHSFWVNDVRRGASGPVVAAEFATSCLAAGLAPKARYADAMARNPHIRFSGLDNAGYVLIEMTPKALTADLRAVSDAADPAASVTSLARFGVEDGRPGAVAA